MRKNSSWLSAFLLILCAAYLQGQVVVYNYPDTLAYSQSLGKNLRSFLYQVDIQQANKTYSSYVLADENTFPDGQRNLMTDWHHFSTFSFQGEIEVEITRLDGQNIQKATVYPLAFKVPFEYAGNKLKLRLTEPRKLYIELDGLEKQPLFLFADALEKDPPKPEASNVLLLKPGMSAQEVKNAITQSNRPIVYFAPGIHRFGVEKDISYPGYRLPLLSNKTYYIPGGAYVQATFYGDNVSNTRVHGRGIISLCGQERLGSSVPGSFNYHAIFFNGPGQNQVVEGISINNVPHFCILSRGTLRCNNVKLFGWWHQTDGFGGGDASLIEDSFLKVNDDYVKLYRTKNQAKNLVIYKQINGAVIQLGWNAYGACQDCLAEDIYVVKDAPKVPGTISNTAVVNLVNNEGSNISGVSIRNVYMDNDVQRSIGLKASGGKVSNLRLSNFSLRGKNLASNYVIAPLGSAIEGLQLENIQINGRCISSNAEYNLQMDGNVTELIYWCGTSSSKEQLSKDTFSIMMHRNELYVLNHQLNGKGHLTVFDLAGREILKGSIEGPESRLKMNALKGLYVVKIDWEGAIWTGKLLWP
jgi:hypothetical protein